MELNEALLQIAQIRRQMARSETFVGYRAATTAFTGIVALGASAIQVGWRLERADQVLGLWLGAAAVSLIVVAIEMIVRTRRSESDLQREMTAVAVEQFVPCLVAGALLTYVLRYFAPAGIWLLPGLWAVLFGLGIFASRRVLPRGTSIVGGYYLLAGLLCIATRAQRPQFDGWQMAVEFGVGQFLAAGVLHWNLERKHATQNER